MDSDCSGPSANSKPARSKPIPIPKVKKPPISSRGSPERSYLRHSGAYPKMVAVTAGPSTAAPSTTAAPSVSSSRTPHPQAWQICQMIDTWFSDENIRGDPAKNIPGDRGILNAIKAKGENSPVNVYRVSGRLMHQFHPKPTDWQIIDACRNSTMVDVVDKKHIQRKQPFVLDDSDIEDGNWAEGDRRLKMRPIPIHPGLKAGTFMKTVATGFEMNFADAPMTLQEANEEKELYGLDVDIPSRVGHAIERYIARRKFGRYQQKAFGDFLRFSGINPVSRIGQGQSKKEIMEDEELTKDEKLEMCAQYDVDADDKLDDGKWSVNFETVAKAFLSIRFAEDLDIGYTEEKVDITCSVLSNFYNYLLHHDVCPECDKDIKAAQYVTVLARRELKSIHHLVRQFPSPFGKACSVLFGGRLKPTSGESKTWSDGDDTEDESLYMSRDDAKVIIGAAFASLAPDLMYNVVFPDDDRVEVRFEALALTNKLSVTLTIVEIERATVETCKQYEQSGLDGKTIEAPPLGKLVCEIWKMPTVEDYDAHSDPQANVLGAGDKYTFWLEDDVLADFCIGMKLSGDICKLELKDSANHGEGIWIIDSLSRIYCSFFTLLPNEVAQVKIKDVAWLEEDAMSGCEHPQAEKAKEVYAEMCLEKKVAEKAAK